MKKEKYIITIHEEVKPYNVYMVLPLSIFKKVQPILEPEILKGRVDCDQQDNIILFLLLDGMKIKTLRKFCSSLEIAPQYEKQKK
ncbi:MAG: hypothetical protein NVS9B7_10230 [Flavisolibacter sp.]